MPRLESQAYALRGTAPARSRAKAASWLFIGLLPTLLACGAKRHSQPTIRAGNARFEFLTPSLVRMEYSPAGGVIDAPTAVVQKRTGRRSMSSRRRGKVGLSPPAAS